MGADRDDRLPGRAARPPRDAKENPDEESYPDDKLVEGLASLKSTLQAIKDPKEILRPPSNFDLEGFNIFAMDQADGAGDMTMPRGVGPAGPGIGIGPPGMRGGARMARGRDMDRMDRGLDRGMRVPGGVRNPRAGAVPDETGLEEDLPEYCMVRLMDVDVQPGKVYQYRLRVRMANPNFSRNDVASPAYKKEKEIKGGWYEVPQKAVVPPELFYYAVDQKELDGRTQQQQAHRRLRYEGRVDPKEQVVLQAHRWLPGVPLKENNNQPMPVGDWVIAERMPVYRGETIGRYEKVDVPVWLPRKETMTLLKDTSNKRGASGVDVYFGYGPEQQEAILVDFEGGRRSYARVAGRSDDPDKKPPTRTIDDESSTEVLILSPDGKLMARNGAADAKDKEREKRLKEVRENIQKCADEGKILNLLNNPAGGAGGPGGRGGNSFGGGR